MDCFKVNKIIVEWSILCCDSKCDNLNQNTVHNTFKFSYELVVNEINYIYQVIKQK